MKVTGAAPGRELSKCIPTCTRLLSPALGDVCQVRWGVWMGSSPWWTGARSAPSVVVGVMAGPSWGQQAPLGAQA